MHLTQPMPQPHATASGIGCLIAGIAIFSVQDVILKRLSGAYPLYEALILRSLTALPFLFLFVHLNGGLRTLVSPGWRRMLARGFVMFAAYTCYYLTLAALPLATTVALYFTGPLFITLLSVVLLKEPVGIRRWSAVIAGFLGVIIMVRPGSSFFDWAAVLGVSSGLTYGLSMVAARRLGATETAAALAFWGNIVFLLCAIGLALIFGSGRFAADTHPSLAFLMRSWVTPSPADLLAMMACGVIAATGLTLLTQAYRVAESSVVAPFEYTAMVWGVVFGWFFWREWPDAPGWIGIAIIVGAGLYVLYREGVRSGPPT
ncbi:MAG: DMT family transporter [Rhodobacteraceae bacterium]|nr:DMT family transporter [Paracoccaceae bacterium]